MTEKEYIEREALLEDIDETVVFTVKTVHKNLEIRGANKVIDRIKAVPTADVQEVRHGKWIKRDVFGEDLIECDCCGNTVSVYGYNYCPNCGAKTNKE